ncbi:Transcriptional regulatory protein uhpA [Delftia tsuruhatensis]|uniref:helix-turn-helix domain-containing protein n=1 Tax=Delftia tsuruhatensis TaxID=180282 RepID=UPI001E783874|nr:helix-turn-helix transcriptional regulator [Delftia tsuruhatensis]CAB5691377.1 Transcriptional regulatory protein uhpA [Delftia tsuruhatensis]CAC9676894.1 Transcriptional regulatory protein uhpA [Delftia tsuruhatensis]
METHEPVIPTPARNALTPEAVRELGRPTFHATLLRGLHDAVGADHLTHLRYDRGGRIGYARCASLRDQSMIEWTTDVYVDRLYLRDPNYERVCHGTRDHARDRASQVHLTALSSQSIRDTEYRQELFEKPGFASKISLLGFWEGHACYVNLYFSHAVSGDTTTLLHCCAPLLIALAQRHGEIVGAQPTPLTEPLSGMGSLSTRERQVAELLWQGRTAKETARALQISPTTVLTYKARLFEKAQVANLKEFLLKAPSRSPR